MSVEAAVMRTTWLYPISTLYLKPAHAASRTQPTPCPCSGRQFINGAVLHDFSIKLVMHSDYVEFTHPAAQRWSLPGPILRLIMLKSVPRMLSQPLFRRFSEPHDGFGPPPLRRAVCVQPRRAVAGCGRGTQGGG